MRIVGSLAYWGLLQDNLSLQRVIELSCILLSYPLGVLTFFFGLWPHFMVFDGFFFDNSSLDAIAGSLIIVLTAFN